MGIGERLCLTYYSNREVGLLRALPGGPVAYATSFRTASSNSRTSREVLENRVKGSETFFGQYRAT